MTWLARGLRVIGITIAVLAWIDPVVTQTQPPPLVAVLAGTDGDRATLAAARGALAGVARVTSVPDPAADAWVAIAGPSGVLPAAPDGVPLSVVVPPPATRTARIDRVDAPPRVTAGSRARVRVAVHGEAMDGRSTTVVLRNGPLEIDRATHTWTRADERATIAFGPLLGEAGPARLRVEVRDTGGPATATEVVIDVDDRRLPVLVVDGRPSWMTTFVRRALQADAGLEVTALTRVARGVTAGGGGGGGALTDETLAGQAVVVVGAPEALTAGDVAAIERFVRRGGRALLVPDGLALGPARVLVPAADIGERLLETPVRVALPTDPPVMVWASELALPRRLLAGAEAAGLVSGQTGAESAILASPLGAGRFVYAGTLDAWRFRDRDEAAFDRAWSALVRHLGTSGVERVSWRVTPAMARPGDRVEATLRLHDALLAGDRIDLDARLGETPLRLQPAATAGTFTAVLNAPSKPGVFAVSVRVTGCRAPSGVCSATTALMVAADAQAARRPGSTESLRAEVEAGGGVVVESGRLDALRAHVSRVAPASRRPQPWFPMRSAWWLLPFALALGGEWYLRRRIGER